MNPTSLSVPGANPRAFLALIAGCAFLIVLIAAAPFRCPPASAANPAGVRLEATPKSAMNGDLVKVRVYTSGGSEGVWFSKTNLDFVRGYFDHCGWCATPCLVGDEIQGCSDCCGPYCLSCTWSSGHEFSSTWFGGPTWEFRVNGCGEATVTPTYYGGSHEGPYTLGPITIAIEDGIVAAFEVLDTACAGEELEFENTSCGGDLYRWDFGDGHTSTEESPVHVYEDTGLFTVTLTASGKAGSDSHTATVLVVDDCAVVRGTGRLAATGETLPGVTVKAYGPAGSRNPSATTTAIGTYRFVVSANVPYSLMAQKPGFDTIVGPTVTLAPHEECIWNPILNSGDPDDVDPDSVQGDHHILNVEDPVNPATGNFYDRKRLFAFPGRRGLGLGFSLSYNSAAATEDGPAGHGWTHAYNVTLAEQGDQVAIRFGDGHREFFRWDAVQAAYLPERSHPSVVLEKLDPEGWKAGIGYGFFWEFDAQGRLVRIFDLNGNAVVLEHSTRLDRMTDTHGRVIEFAYDAEGRLSHIDTPLVADDGHTVVFEYDAGGNLTRLTDPRGHSWTFGYDAEHRLTRENDRRGIAVLTNVYDAGGRIVEQVDAAGESTRFGYHEQENGLRVVITPPSGMPYTHDYDEGYHLVRVTDALGLSARFAPGPHGQPVAAEDKRGRSAAFGANALGLPTHITDRRGISTYISYNAHSQVTAVVDQFGRRSTFTYDARGNISSSENRVFDYTRYLADARGQTYRIAYPAFGGEWDLEYTAEGLLSTVTDTYDQTTSLQYDDAGRMTGISYADGLGAVTAAYDANGNYQWVTSRLGHRTAFTFDENDNLLTRTFEPTGAVTRYTYDTSGRLETVTDAMDGVTTLAYDAAGNLVSVEDPDGVVLSFAYDARNLVSSATASSGRTTRYGYGPNGNRVWARDALGNTRRWSYDAEGRIASYRDPLGYETTYERNDRDTRLVITDALGRRKQRVVDDEGRLVEVVGPDGTAWYYDRNTAGLPTRLLDERDHSWRYAYDALGRLAGTTDPSGKTESYQYDAVGNLVAIHRRNGDVLHFAYDLDRRRTRMELPGEIVVTWTYTHDADDGTSTVVMTEPEGSTTSVYDRLGRLVSHEDRLGHTVQYGYTAAGRLRSITYPGGLDVVYRYDAHGRLGEIEDWTGGVTSFAHDALDRVSEIDYPNGTRTRYTRDARGDVTAIRHLDPDGEEILEFAYTRDALGRIASADRSDTLASLVADAAGEFSYDAANRLLSATFGPVSATYQFDANGNLATRTAGGVATSFTYDALNRLTAVFDGTTATGYTYDYLGRRLSKTHGGAETRYQRLGGSVYTLFDASDTPLSYQVYSDRLLYSISPEGSKRVYHTDVRGSVVALSDDTGTPEQRYAYGPYGQVIGASGDVDSPFGFVGAWGVLSDENGLLQMQSRYYDPALRRFVTEDPLGTATGPNLYAYAAGDPVNRIDPEGLDPSNPPPDRMSAVPEPLAYTAKPSTVFDIDPQSYKIRHQPTRLGYKRQLLMYYGDQDPRKSEELEYIFGQYYGLQDNIRSTGNRPDCVGCTKSLMGINSANDYNADVDDLQYFELVHVGVRPKEAYGTNDTQKQYAHHATGVIDRSTGKLVAILDPIPPADILGIPLPMGQKTELLPQKLDMYHMLNKPQAYDFANGILSPSGWKASRSYAYYFHGDSGVAIIPE